MARLAPVLGAASLVVALLAFACNTPGLKTAIAPALLHGAVWLAVLATGARLASGAPVTLPAGATWVAAALVVGWGQASRAWAANPLFVGPVAYLEIEALFFFLLMPQLIDSWRRARQMAGVYLAMSTLWAAGAACIMCAARWGPESWGYGWHSARGFAWPTFNPNFTALILEPGLLLAIAVVLTATAGTRLRALAAAAGLVHLVAFALIRSMGSVLALAVGGAALLAILGGRRGRILVVSCAVLAVLVGGMLAADIGPAPLQRAGNDVRESMGMRGLLARRALATWRATARSTWLGHGLGGYMPAAIPHRPRAYFLHPQAAASTPHPHGELWKVLAERGLIGALLVGLLLAVLLWRARSLVLGPDPRAHFLGAVALAAVLALTTHGQVTIFLAHPLGVFLWWGWAAVLACPLERVPPAEPPRPALGGLFALALCAILGSFFVHFAWGPLSGAMDARQAELMLREAAAARRAGRPHEAREQTEHAARLLELSLTGLAGRGETHDSLRARERLAQAWAAAGQPGPALRYLEDILQRCPGYGITEWRMASTAVLAQQYALANQYFLRSLDRNPLEIRLYQEWWDRRNLLATPATRRAMLERCKAGLAWLERGRRAGLVSPDDRRQRQLETIKIRLELR